MPSLPTLKRLRLSGMFFEPVQRKPAFTDSFFTDLDSVTRDLTVLVIHNMWICPFKTGVPQFINLRILELSDVVVDIDVASIMFRASPIRSLTLRDIQGEKRQHYGEFFALFQNTLLDLNIHKRAATGPQILHLHPPLHTLKHLTIDTSYHLSPTQIIAILAHRSLKTFSVECGSLPLSETILSEDHAQPLDQLESIAVKPIFSASETSLLPFLSPSNTSLRFVDILGSCFFEGCEVFLNALINLPHHDHISLSFHWDDYESDMPLDILSQFSALHLRHLHSFPPKWRWLSSVLRSLLSANSRIVYLNFPLDLDPKKVKQEQLLLTLQHVEAARLRGVMLTFTKDITAVTLAGNSGKKVDISSEDEDLWKRWEQRWWSREES
ncbi:hypothetical protein BT69DRAFT_1334376 [Atractiella rhizophila]|nr:hypothetical protein BT69DRAFT_1334376 [Atractiella rhizophila]